MAVKNGVIVLDDVLILRQTVTGWQCEVPAHPQSRFIAILRSRRRQ